MIYAQWILLSITFIQFFVLIYRDINGRPAKAPTGFSGVVSTIISVIVSLCLYYFSGALSLIFG